MSRNILLILGNEPEADAVRRSLTDIRDGRFEFESVSGCGEALERLGDRHGEEIAAVIVDLFLADSQGIETFDKLAYASSHIPILVLSHQCDEGIAKLAVQRGAQDYLLHERLDGYWLSKSLDNMLERCAYADVLLLERERAEVTLDSIGDAVISTDVAGNVTYLNEVAESMTGWSRQEASGRRLPEVLQIIDGESREPALNPLAMAILYDKTVGVSSNCLLVRRDGHEFAIEDTAAPIHDRHGQVTGAVIVFHDVGAARAMALRMSHLAQHDFLTELPNRMLLNDRLTQAIASANRHGKSLALLFLDVDHFKRINDSLGHAGGDQILKSIAWRLAACVRGSDTVSRLGGDEFVVLLSEVTRTEDAGSTAAKILAAVSRPYRIEDQDLHVTMSMGVAIYPGDGANAETLMKNADLALLHSKAYGRGNHRFYEPTMTAVEQRLGATSRAAQS